ncbi:MAG: isoprenylcysteine carboxylmethyltransferase family protein [Candidatus Sulfotelmatobacter sp.]|jgi:protein-S-isoprenylcysteine O-methyltransferase Ste14
MQDRHRHAFTAIQLVGVVALFWLLITLQTPWNTQRYAGTVLAVVGLIFIGIARYQLGKSFSIKPEAHALVTTGLYSKIRNPIYVFGMVMLTGLVLVLQRPVGWLVVVAGVIGQSIRARREARVLEAAFGDEYREYRRKTWF